MTTPGPDHFFFCPQCKTVLRRATYLSGNTFGSTLWSDGYLDAPMMPDTVEVTRCPSCSKAFFVEDAESIGEFETSGAQDADISSPPEICRSALAASDADLDALAELVLHTPDDDRLRFLRLKIWHLHNDAHRNPGNEPSESKPKNFSNNLEELILHLEDDGGQDQLMKAEALRELGRHTEALSSLQGIGTDLAWASNQIRSMAQEGVTDVAILRRPGSQSRRV